LAPPPAREKGMTYPTDLKRVRVERLEISGDEEIHFQEIKL
jgi:hypothetical protein